MPVFNVKYRKLSPIMITQANAETHEEAVAQIVAAAAPGEEVQVMDTDVGFPVREGQPTGG